MNGSRDDSDGRSLERIEQALLAEDPEFVQRWQQRSAGLATTPAAPVDLTSLLVVLWCSAGALVLLSLAAGSLVGASGTCLLVLVLHRRVLAAAAAAPQGAPGPRTPQQH